MGQAESGPFPEHAAASFTSARFMRVRLAMRRSMSAIFCLAQTFVILGKAGSTAGTSQQQNCWPATALAIHAAKPGIRKKYAFNM